MGPHMMWPVGGGSMGGRAPAVNQARPRTRWIGRPSRRGRGVDLVLRVAMKVAQLTPATGRWRGSESFDRVQGLQLRERCDQAPLLVEGQSTHALAVDAHRFGGGSRA